MKGELIKRDDSYWLHNDNGESIATSWGVVIGKKLSKQNCNSLFGVVDVEKLAMDWRESTGYHDADSYSYILGFKKAMELNKDKVFTLEQMSVAYNTNRSGTLFEQLINSFGGQPTEIEVEIEMDICGDKVYAVPEPKIDENGCLILKRVI
jgi:hypothetical protein